MKKVTLLAIGALAFVFQNATAQIILFSANFEKVFIEPGGGGQPRDDNGNLIIAYMPPGGDITYWGVEDVLDSTYVNTTRAAVLDWTMTAEGWFSFSIAPQASSLAASAGSLDGLAFSFDVYTEGAATADFGLTIWFDQYQGSGKTFDASISPAITTDGRWNHVSFTLDHLTPSGTSGAYDPTLGLEMSFDGGGMSMHTGDTGQIVLDNIQLLLQTPKLNTTQSGNSVIVSWPNIEGCVLQQSSSLGATADWTTSSYSISTSNGMNSVTITLPAAGSLFFRLYLPPLISPETRGVSYLAPKT